MAPDADSDWPNPPRNKFESIFRGFYNIIDGPVTWFRETIVEPNRPKYYYYHRRFRRVPEIDECYEGDEACIFEANSQFKRDKKVDSEILILLRQRRDDCVFYERPDHLVRCEKIVNDYNEAAVNWFIKYGDLGGKPHVIHAFMKQKHRLIWERRHGGPNDGLAKDS